ncbi:MAG: response regulator [Deltaproteobacteria bacterium]|nr:response regulator [Deltaproteobacteria bacterium]
MGLDRMQGGRAERGGKFVLAVDDELSVLRVLDRILRGVGLRVMVAQSEEQMSHFLVDPDLAVVLLDLFMGQAKGVDVLDRIKRERNDVEVVVVTGHGSIDSAVRCMRRGAFEYLEKPFRDLGRIRATVHAALARHAENIRVEVAEVALCVDERATHGPGAIEASVPLSLAAYERLALERALQESDGDARRAARSLGIGRSTFYRKAANLDISLGRDADAEPDADEGAEPRDGVGRRPSIG